MIDEILSQESAWRLIIFLSVFVAMSLLEIASPRRRLQIPRLFRWSNNLALVVVDTILVRIAIPILPVGTAALAADRDWGLLNSLAVPLLAAVVISLLLLDLLIYFQHRVFHAVPLLWRLHRMHHADLEFDVTTGIRFHPIEILLSMLLKVAVVLLLGAPAIAVLMFEIILNATALFNHANLRMPKPVDKFIRWFLVTPDMHRVHHSVIPQETNSNFGFNVPWWDKIFKTYRDQPTEGHTHMDIGLGYFRNLSESRIDQLLVQPFKNPEE